MVKTTTPRPGSVSVCQSTSSTPKKGPGSGCSKIDQGKLARRELREWLRDVLAHAHQLSAVTRDLLDSERTGEPAADLVAGVYELFSDTAYGTRAIQSALEAAKDLAYLERRDEPRG